MAPPKEITVKLWGAAMTLELNNANAHAILQRKDLDMKRFLENAGSPARAGDGTQGWP
nr:hypothetical protein GCM10020185_78640 [Pseudomonas brassicacearum subsp. brassicacearum]